MAIQSYLVFAQFGLFLGRYGSKMPRSLVIQHFFVISGNSLKPPGHKRNRPKILPEVVLISYFFTNVLIKVWVELLFFYTENFFMSMFEESCYLFSVAGRNVDRNFAQPETGGQRFKENPNYCPRNRQRAI